MKENLRVLLIGNVKNIDCMSTELTIKENKQNFNYEKVLTPKSGFINPKLFKLFIYPFLILFYRGYDAYHIIDHSYGHLAYFLPKKKTVVTCHDIIPLVFKQNVSFIGRLLFRFYMSGLKRAKIIIADSQNTKKDLIKILKIDSSKIRVVPNCIDFTNFKKLNQKERLKERHGLKNKKVILCLGSGFYKNISRVLKASKQIIKKYPETIVLKIGNFGEPEKNLLKKLDLKKHIIKKTNLSEKEIIELYNCADVLVYPNLYAGFARPPFEAMACGTPVITSNLPFMDEVDDKKSLLIVNPYSVKEIENAVLSIFENPSLRRNLVKRATKTVNNAKKSIKEKCSRAFLETYQKL